MMEVKNQYWVLRHGRSRANEAGVIVSSPANGAKPEYGLTEAGREQARAAGRALGKALAALRRQAEVQGRPPPRVVVCASPFSRTLETAALAAEAAGLQVLPAPLSSSASAAVSAAEAAVSAASAGADASPTTVVAATTRVVPEPLLRERFFGARYELTSHDNYSPAWAGDAADAASRPAPDAESVADVAARVTELFARLEGEGREAVEGEREDGAAAAPSSGGDGEGSGGNGGAAAGAAVVVLLVSHGDTLSILQAAFHGAPLTRHREWGLETAELRALNAPPGIVAAAAAAAGAAGAAAEGVAAAGAV